MKKFIVSGIVETYVSIELTEEDLREYMEFDDVNELEMHQICEIAEEAFGGVNSFCGNGGCDKLVGVTGSNESIDVGERIGFEEVEIQDEDGD